MATKHPPRLKKQKEVERYEWEVFFDRDEPTGNLELSVEGDVPNINIKLPRRNPKFQGHTIYHLAGIDDQVWSEIRKIAYHQSFDCDRSIKCHHSRSAQFCYTKNYKHCPGYKLAK